MFRMCLDSAWFKAAPLSPPPLTVAYDGPRAARKTSAVLSPVSRVSLVTANQFWNLGVCMQSLQNISLRQRFKHRFVMESRREKL